MTPEGVVGWPEEFARRYRARGFWAGIPIGDAFARSVAEHGEREALVDGARRLTYRELGRLVDRLALHLAARGISGGAPVVFQLPNVWQFVVAYFACLSLSLADLVRFLEDQRIARFKLPERLELVERFPTTAVGKISKTDLREDVARRLAREAGA